MANRDNTSNHLTTLNKYAMKVSAPFKNAIQSYLEQRAEYDELFARSYRNPLKNIEDCITYILNYVQKSGCNGFDDDEIFGQAVHYYDEADIEIGKPIDCKVVVNHHLSQALYKWCYPKRNIIISLLFDVIEHKIIMVSTCCFCL